MKHHLTMRASSDPEFLNRHCKKINHSEEDVGTMQNLISHFLLKNTGCLRI